LPPRRRGRRRRLGAPLGTPALLARCASPSLGALARCASPSLGALARLSLRRPFEIRPVALAQLDRRHAGLVALAEAQRQQEDQREGGEEGEQDEKALGGHGATSRH
jgi:hypothetical protein